MRPEDAAIADALAAAMTQIHDRGLVPTYIVAVGPDGRAVFVGCSPQTSAAAQDDSLFRRINR